jgi:hypothetical protein
MSVWRIEILDWLPLLPPGVEQARGRTSEQDAKVLRTAAAEAGIPPAVGRRAIMMAARGPAKWVNLARRFFRPADFAATLDLAGLVGEAGATLWRVDLAPRRDERGVTTLMIEDVPAEAISRKRPKPAEERTCSQSGNAG